jgi:hypothetical protein
VSEGNERRDRPRRSTTPDHAPAPAPMNRARLNELADALGADPVYLERDFVLTEIIRSKCWAWISMR